MKGKCFMNHLKKGFALVFIVVLILSISASALAETGVFNTAAVNLRTAASKSSSSKGLVSKGATCNILEESGSWLKVYITSHTKNDPDLIGQTGWVMAKYVDRSGSSSGGSGEGSGSNKTYDDIPSTGSLTNGTVKLNSGYLKVRALPSQSSNKIGELEDGASVTYYNGKLNSVGSDSYTWYKLTSPYKGFVATNYIEANAQPAEEKCLVCGRSYDEFTKTYQVKSWDPGKGTLASDGTVWYPATAYIRYRCPVHSDNYYDDGTVDGYYDGRGTFKL